MPAVRWQFAALFQEVLKVRRSPNVEDNGAPKSWVPRQGLQHDQSRSRRSNHPASSTRPPSSTRSMIDPTPSPVSAFSSLEPAALQRLNPPHLETLTTHPIQAHARLQSSTPEEHLLMRFLRDMRSRRRHKKSNTSANRQFTCFPTRSKAVRRQIISCLITGFALAIILTLCKDGLHIP